MSPNIWTLTDLPSPITNPVPARLSDKFDRPEKLATSSEEQLLSNGITYREYMSRVRYRLVHGVF
jgi:hypothetical protein